jgi:Domain of unknown function (DUF4397)
MQRKLLRIAGLYGMLLATFGALLAGCVDEPTIEPVGQMITPLRFVNCIVDLPDSALAVDIWLDSTKYVDGLGYKGIEDYKNVHSGTRYLRVTIAGAADTSNPLLGGRIFFRSLAQTTMLLHGRLNAAGNDDAGILGLTITQERSTYSDETAKLPQDSGRIKLIHCVVSHTTSKAGAITLFDTTTIAGTEYIESRISNVSPPPVASGDFANLSAYTKHPVGNHKFGVRFGSLPFISLEMPVDRKYYTFVVTGVLNDKSTWDVLILNDSDKWAAWSSTQ